MLNEFVYCPRLFFYEWVEGVFTASADTVEGELRHEKMETRADALPEPGANERIHSRSVMLSSDTYGLIAKIDLVEGDGTSGRPRRLQEGPAPRDRRRTPGVARGPRPDVRPGAHPAR